MTYLEAALEVLKASGRPMTAEEITDTAISRGLLESGSKTPVRSMTSRLYRYVRDAPEPKIKRHAQPGPSRAIKGSVSWSFVTHTSLEAAQDERA